MIKMIVFINSSVLKDIFCGLIPLLRATNLIKLPAARKVIGVSTPNMIGT